MDVKEACALAVVFSGTVETFKLHLKITERWKYTCLCFGVFVIDMAPVRVHLELKVGIPNHCLMWQVYTEIVIDMNAGLP